MGQQTSGPKITPQDKAVFQLKQQRDKIKQYQRKLEVLKIKQGELARRAVSDKQSDKAKFYLRAKKQQESTISKTYEQLDNLETLINTIEFKLIEKDVVYGLSEGNKVLHKLNNELKIEKIDKIMEDVEENKIKVDEVSDILGSHLTNLEEAELDNEFAELEREVNGKTQTQVEMPEAPKDAIFPDVAKGELASSNREETVPNSQRKQENATIEA